MKYKTFAILAAVLAALILYVYFFEVRRPAEQQRLKETEQKVFLFSKEDVRRLTLNYPEKKIVCAKKPDGDWKLVFPIETDGDKNAIDRIVSNLEGAKKEQVVADKAANLSEFGLLSPKVTIILDLKDGTTDTLLLGDRSPTGEFVFARRSSQPQVFTLPSWLLGSLEKAVYDLRDKRVLVFDQAEVEKVELAQGRKRIICIKAGSEWQMEQPLKVKADSDEIDRLLTELKDAQTEEFVEEKPDGLKKYALHKPRAEVTLWVGKEKARKSLRIGKEKDGKYYAWDESRSPVFLVKADLVGQLEKTPFDLRDKAVATFEIEEIDRLELIYPASALVCVKDAPGSWQLTQPVARKAKDWKVSGILSDIKRVKAEEFVAEKAKMLSQYGLNKPQIIARLWKNEKEIVEIWLGKKKDGLVYVKTKQKPTVFLVKESIVNDLSVAMEDIAEKVTESGKESEKKRK